MTSKPLTIPCPGYDIAADWYAGDTTKILLALTGYMSNKSRYIEFAESIASQTGSSVLVIDYSGHGDSPLSLDDTRPAQHFLEVICAFDWLRARYPDADISVIGYSYGSFHAAHLAKYRSLKKLVLRAPAIYQPTDMYSLQPQIDRDYTSNIYRKNAAALAAHPLFMLSPTFATPVLVVVHGKDEDVPVETTNAYANALNAEKYIAKDFKHSMRDPENPNNGQIAYYTAIADWLNK